MYLLGLLQSATIMLIISGILVSMVGIVETTEIARTVGVYMHL